MRDLQRHVFYLGHKELLNLEQAAAIDLLFQPEAVTAGLAAREVAWELWGKPDDAEAADWQPLEATVGAGSVRLHKAWLGKTAETEVGGKKSRWLRARLLTPMVGRLLRLLRRDRAAGALRGATGRSRGSAHGHPRLSQRHAATAARPPAAVRSRAPAVRSILPRRPRGTFEDGRPRDPQIELADASIAAVTAGPGAEPMLIGWHATGDCRWCATG